MEKNYKMMLYWTPETIKHSRGIIIWNFSFLVFCENEQMNWAETEMGGVNDFLCIIAVGAKKTIF